MIYLLEDDDSIRKLVDYTLKSQNYQTESFALPSEFWKAMTKKPDLILLDIMLPEEDGISILKKLRANKETSGIPVIMLTAKDSEFDIVTGLDSGADDYVTKPFGMMALLSRIKAVLRRYEKNNAIQSNKKELSLGNIKLNESRHTVFVGEKQIFLTVKEFELLALLIENKGNVLTREQLLNSIWKIDADIESRTVDVHVRTLRQKIGDENGEIIETVRGIGYKIG
ncbi:MAG: response regulator transcription factor [Treponema sp.]|jgi:two-component system alkaline phosphatase synthesis response regulator PhoP|nr:response regulator transcription factor [Treponema sp.]